MPLKYLQDDFLCRFCSSKTEKRVKALESEVEELKKMISPENTKSISAPAKPTRYSEILKNLKSEEREQERRACNVIISGSKAAENGKELLQNILHETKTVATDGLTTKRIGKVNEDGLQMLLVTIGSADEGNNLLKKARLLRDKEKYKNIFLQPDLTKDERAREYTLRCDLRKIREENPDNEYIIRAGKVVEKARA